MNKITEDRFDERVADVYDELYQDFDPNAITLLTELASGGRALELGIGTGRIALPLKERGADVSGIDMSPPMVAKLRAKPGGADILVIMGSFVDVAVAGDFNLIYVLFNTFFDLLTQEEQVCCFANVAGHLSPSGVFVIEAFVPDPTLYNGRQSLRTISIGKDEVHVNAALIDPVKQQITSQQIRIGEEGIRLFPVKLRYAYPAELDLMARLAGLRLRQRWGDWARSPFTADSGKHVSVYERA
jgi:SAM-dependent methyltransferase